MRVGEALRRAREALAPLSDSAGSDARLLVAHSLGASTTWVLSHDGDRLDDASAGRFEHSLARCLGGEPLPYVLGRWEFWGRSFLVDRTVLIPRPETELLVEHALAEMRRTAGRVVEVGTGSGCVAITLAREIEAAVIVATDVSREALRLARRNASAHGVEGRLRLVQADLLRGLASPWDLVCANLPYLPSRKLEELPVARHEPHLALDGGTGGTALSGALVRSLGAALAPGGLALVELDDGQADELSAAARLAVPGSSVEVRLDLAGRERLLIVRREA